MKEAAKQVVKDMAVDARKAFVNTLVQWVMMAVLAAVVIGGGWWYISGWFDRKVDAAQEAVVETYTDTKEVTIELGVASIERTREAASAANQAIGEIDLSETADSATQFVNDANNAFQNFLNRREDAEETTEQQ